MISAYSNIYFLWKALFGLSKCISDIAVYYYTCSSKLFDSSWWLRLQLEEEVSPFLAFHNLQICSLVKCLISRKILLTFRFSIRFDCAIETLVGKTLFHRFEPSAANSLICIAARFICLYNLYKCSNS